MTFSSIDVSSGAKVAVVHEECWLDGRRHPVLRLQPDVVSARPFVFLHGAGGALKESILPVASHLLARGVPIVAFDHSGVGDDAPNLYQSGLEARVKEARHVVDRYAPTGPVTLAATSMGGHVALRLLEHCRVESLVLFAPAIYSRAADEVLFGADFTREIRMRDSWRNSRSLDLLRGFRGTLLIVIGSADKVIPADVFECLAETSRAATRREVYKIISGPHGILSWLRDHPAIARRVSVKISSYAAG